MSHVAVPCSFDCSQADGQCPLQDGVCLAILAQPEHQREIVVRATRSAGSLGEIPNCQQFVESCLRL